jgi:glycosyltransferase involved in cell wall biosynthesis
MKILVILNYYYPYISGISETGKKLAEGFANAGNDVTILTSNHAKLAKEEFIGGVKVVRAPIIAKISKGTVSPAFIFMAKKMAMTADSILLHLPMIESGIIASIVNRKKLFVLYHCDINLDKGLFNKFISRTMDFSNKIALKKCRNIICHSIDYAQNSRIAKYFTEKLVEIYAPIKPYKKIGTEPHAKKRIGFCGRIVKEKGIDILLRAFGIIKTKIDAELIIGGDYLNVAGGSTYEELVEYIKKNDVQNVKFLGKIPEEKMAEFYSSLDVFVLPSINSMEAFGMVQVEAMLCGVPVVASNLPGVKTIVQKTGMGLLCKKNDAENLAQCILKILETPENYIKNKDDIECIFSTEKILKDCLNVLEGNDA